MNAGIKSIGLCGEEKDLYFDGKVKKLDLELVKWNGFYCIEFNDCTKKNKWKKLLRLHIREAIELKSMIDTMVLDVCEDELENATRTGMEYTILRLAKAGLIPIDKAAEILDIKLKEIHRLAEEHWIDLGITSKQQKKSKKNNKERNEINN